MSHLISLQIKRQEEMLDITAQVEPAITNDRMANRLLHPERITTFWSLI